jgi:hypothetical protein
VPVNKILVSIVGRNMEKAHGEVTNISEAGACIAADHLFAEDEIVLLRINFYNQPDAFVTQAEIAWSREEEHPEYSEAHGVKFRFSEKLQQERLRGILGCPDFKLVCPPDNEPLDKDELGDLVTELTDDLHELGKKHDRVVGNGG